MLSQEFLSIIERDLTVARQLARFHFELCANEQNAHEVNKSGPSGGALHHKLAAPSDLRDGRTIGAGSAHTHAVLSNPVQRPRQGTCAVLLELSRSLEWLSQRSRHREPGAGVGSASRTGTTAATSSLTNRHINHESAAGALSVGGVGFSSDPIASINNGTSASAATTGSHHHAKSINLESSAGVSSAVQATNCTLSGNTGAINSPAAAAPGWPLIVATVVFEVVFPARYPTEPCQWQLFEEASFACMGNHATSSWAVTAGHHPGNTKARNSSAAHRPCHKSIADPSGSHGNSQAWNAGGRADGTASRVASPATPTLTAFVASEVGRRLLRWISEARAGIGASLTPSFASLATMTGGNETANAWRGPAHRYGSGISKTCPFLLDFAALLRCWSTVELDVHHLVLPSHIALAYGGGGARVPRTMAGTYLSRGGIAAAPAPTAVGLLAPVAPVSLPAAGGALSGSTAANGASAQTAAAAPGTSCVAVVSSLHSGTTSSTASIPAPVQAPGAASAGGGVSGGIAAPGAGPGPSVLYPYCRRPSKCFMAVLLPLGGVAVSGTPTPLRRARHAVDPTTADCNGDVPGAATGKPPLCRLPVCLRCIYDRPQDAHENEKVRAGTVVGCTSQFVLGKVLPSFVLPAHVLSSEYKCDWSKVRFCSGKTAEGTLHANAKLAKALRLPDVSNLLQVLRRLAKNVGTSSAGVLYVNTVLWPALMETVRVLRNRRLPFWAGLAICSLLLPSVLQKVHNEQQAESISSGRSGRGHVPPITVPLDSALPVVGSEPSVQLYRRHLAELIDVLNFTERVLAIAQEHTLLCEARLVRLSLQCRLRLLQRTETDGHHRSTAAATSVATGAPIGLGHGDHSSSAAAWARAGLLTPESPVASSTELCSRLHAPISICAVCGLSLHRNTVTHAGVSGNANTGAAAPLTDARHRAHSAAPAGSDMDAPQRKMDGYGGRPVDAATSTKNSAETMRAILQTRREEGCLVVQCAHCGHGGHVEHISSWWCDPTVRCCPKGCDCRCVY
ncbi:hypothetical protein JKF63_04688 [Porcisia hertigi]|uniref:Uncharacterized protein n=1 Tax=Porcisia hertigi TaxID=2761500 RepID=A0A836IT81_9TRYP|nr:hypothetical protein JKF63_04688 [Porcisia hertigi]